MVIKTNYLDLIVGPTDNLPTFAPAQILEKSAVGIKPTYDKI